jgi:DNA-binding beta-propeller fold protein YncE
MKHFFSITCALIISQFVLAQTGALPQPITLPNGWQLSPAGRSFSLGDLPLNVAVGKSGRYAAVTNNGQSTQQIQLIDIKAEKIVDTLVIQKSFYGLQFSADEQKLYASGGHDNRIMVYDIRQGKLVKADSISLGKPWPNKVGPSGLALDESSGKMYVVTREDKKLYVVDLKTKAVVSQYGLDAEAYDCKLSKDGKELFITCWGCDQLLSFDLVQQSWKQPVHVGDNPNEMLQSADGKLLFVCNANDNTVSVIDSIFFGIIKHNRRRCRLAQFSQCIHVFL